MSAEVWSCPLPDFGFSFERQGDLMVIAQTVLGEAEAEIFEGKLGVAWTLMNRVRDPRWPNSPTAVAMQSRQFSAFNAGSPRVLAMRNPRASTTEKTWELCFKAACAAYFALIPDNTGGANHYLNVKETLRINGKLPKWAAAPGDRSRVNEAKVTARIGRHTFIAW